MRRVNGEGSWDKIVVDGHTYVRFSKAYNGKRKQFTGSSVKEVKKKVSEYETKLNCRENNKDIDKRTAINRFIPALPTDKLILL